MNTSEAVKQRRSIRAFIDKPVPNSLIKDLLCQCSRSASGGNLQPWRIYIINEESMNEFLAFQKNWSQSEIAPYEIYPPKLKEPYRTSRFELGEEMYSLLNISREDKAGRFEQVMKNFEFFGAPAAFFCFVDRQMGPPQWSDLGMFLQTFMLLAKEQGLDTCAQEAWSIKHDSVSNFLRAPDCEMLFCGMSIGYKDHDALINKLESKRRPIEEWAVFV
jgi:nitroreductase